MITQEELKREISYDSKSGYFCWIKRKPGRKFHKRPGTPVKNGYTVIYIAGKRYLSHILAWVYEYGCIPKDEIDHINHNGSDNRIENLREVTKKQNLKNKRIYKSNKSGFSGVYLKNRKWCSSIRVNGKRIWLGEFTDKEYAIEAKKKANIKYGFHENHGKRLDGNNTV